MGCILKEFGCELGAILIGLFWDEHHLVCFEYLKCHLFCRFLEETDESDDNNEEEYDKLDYESGLFGRSGTCDSVPPFDLTLSKGFKLNQNWLSSVCGGGSVGAGCHKHTVGCLTVVDNLFCVCGVVTKTLPGILLIL